MDKKVLFYKTVSSRHQSKYKHIIMNFQRLIYCKPLIIVREKNIFNDLLSNRTSKQTYGHIFTDRLLRSFIFFSLFVFSASIFHSFSHFDTNNKHNLIYCTSTTIISPWLKGLKKSPTNPC